MPPVKTLASPNVGSPPPPQRRGGGSPDKQTLALLQMPVNVSVSTRMNEIWKEVKVVLNNTRRGPMICLAEVLPRRGIVVPRPSTLAEA